MFQELEKINNRPDVFSVYTAAELWTNEYTSKKMLEYHLNPDVDLSSRNAAFIERSVEWIAKTFDVEGKKVVDFGCGPGLYTTALAQKGARVTGIDFSKNSIEYARKTAQENNLTIDYVNANYLDFQSDEKFDLVTMIFCDFCALSPVQRKQLLGIFASILKENGRILMDVSSLNAYVKREEQSSYELNQLFGFWSPNRYYGFVNTFKYDDEKVVLDKYTIIEEASSKTVFNWLQYFSTEMLASEFEAAGLKINQYFSDVAGKSFSDTTDEFAVIAGR